MYFVCSFAIAVACLCCRYHTANNELTHTFNNVKVIVYYENECNSGYRSAAHTTWLLLVMSKALSDLLFRANQNVTLQLLFISIWVGRAVVICYRILVGKITTYPPCVLTELSTIVWLLSIHLMLYLYINIVINEKQKQLSSE